MGFIKGYLESGASQYASMLALSVLVSLLPLMLGVLTVFGLLAGTVGHQQRLVVLRQLLVDIVPANVDGDSIGTLRRGLKYALRLLGAPTAPLLASTAGNISQVDCQSAGVLIL